MKEKDGNITTDREAILCICAEFYPELYSTQKGGNKTNAPNMKSTDDTEVPDITVREVELAVNQMKDYKAPGTDDRRGPPCIFFGMGGVINFQKSTSAIFLCSPI